MKYAHRISKDPHDAGAKGPALIFPVRLRFFLNGAARAFPKKVGRKPPSKSQVYPFQKKQVSRTQRGVIGRNVPLQHQIRGTSPPFINAQVKLCKGFKLTTMGKESFVGDPLPAAAPKNIKKSCKKIKN